MLSFVCALRNTVRTIRTTILLIPVIFITGTNIITVRTVRIVSFHVYRDDVCAFSVCSERFDVLVGSTGYKRHERVTPLESHTHYSSNDLC